jgi:predicted metal-dependent hydrolase
MTSGEHRTINLLGSEMEYVLKHSRSAKNLRLEVSYPGIITLFKPRLASLEKAEKFLIDKQSWLIKKISFFKGLSPYPALSFLSLSRRDFLKNRLMVEKLVRERLEYFNNFYHFSYRRVSIRNQKTRWGSCSRRGSLSFNVRLGSLPADLRDYIVIHELCHLKEFNHSAAFWELVSKQAPDYLIRRQKLKQLKLI